MWETLQSCVFTVFVAIIIVLLITSFSLYPVLILKILCCSLPTFCFLLLLLSLLSDCVSPTAMLDYLHLFPSHLSPLCIYVHAFLSSALPVCTLMLNYCLDLLFWTFYFCSVQHKLIFVIYLFVCLCILHLTLLLTKLMHGRSFLCPLTADKSWIPHSFHCLCQWDAAWMMRWHEQSCCPV